MKKHKIGILILCFLLLFSSCKKSVFKDSLSCKELAQKSSISTFGEDFSEQDKEYAKIFFDGVNYADDFLILYSKDSENIDEIGIFHSKNKENASEMLSLTNSYIQKAKEEQKAFIMSYAPKEAQKLEAARAVQYGNYTVYAILLNDRISSLFNSIETALKQN